MVFHRELCLSQLLSFKEGGCAQKVLGREAEGGSLILSNGPIRMGSTFHDWIDYIWVAFEIKFLK